MTNDPTSAAYEALRQKIAELKFPITGVVVEGPQKYYTFQNRELDAVMQLLKQAIVEAETRGRMIATALFCENNGGSIEVSRSAMVSVPRSSFHIDSYVEPSTEGSVFILYKEDEQANADEANGRAGEDKTND